MPCDDNADVIASLRDALEIETDETWEYSEPMAVGGLGTTPNGTIYPLRAPFSQGETQFKVDFAASGGQQTQVVVSSTRHQFGVDFTGVQPTSGEYSPFDGLVLNLPTNNTVPIDSDWYNVRNSENTVYTTIISNGGASYVNIQFRQKVYKKHGRRRKSE